MIFVITYSDWLITFYFNLCINIYFQLYLKISSKISIFLSKAETVDLSHRNIIKFNFNRNAIRSMVTGQFAHGQFAKKVKNPN